MKLMDLRCYHGPKALQLILFMAFTCPVALAAYNIGVGIADVTGPVAEIVFVRIEINHVK